MLWVSLRVAERLKLSICLVKVRVTCDTIGILKLPSNMVLYQGSMLLVHRGKKNCIGRYNF